MLDLLPFLKAIRMNIFRLIVQNLLEIEYILSRWWWAPPAFEFIPNFEIILLVFNHLPLECCIDVIQNVLEQEWI